jgi:quercetin 2,3-dioxygenase
MKTLYRPGAARMHKEDAWKKSAYAFVPFQTHFGELCGFADDVVLGGKGFGMHPHQNMEISTIILRGKQAHKDNTGGEGVLDGNAVQTMSAGTGIMHSEYNVSATEPFWSYQIWVYPKVQNVTPRHEKFEYKHTAQINQDAFFSLSTLEAAHTIDYSLNESNNGVYIHCAQGEVKIGDFTLNAGDALGIYETQSVQISAEERSELIFVEVPMTRGVKI